MNFNEWYKNADMPTKAPDGSWYDLETGIPFVEKKSDGEKSWLDKRRESQAKLVAREVSRFDDAKRKELSKATLPEIEQKVSKSAAGQVSAAAKFADNPAAEKYLDLVDKASTKADEIAEAIALAGEAGPKTAVTKKIKAMYVEFMELNAEASREQNRVPK